MSTADQPPQVVAATWIFRRGDAVLGVMPRGGTAYYLPGGMPEPGESLAQAAAREVGEEVGVVLDARELREVVRVEADAHGRAGVQVLLVAFAGPGRGEPQADGEEIESLAWLPPDQWGLFAAPVRTALERLSNQAL